MTILHKELTEQQADYYRALEQTQRGGLDVTAWLVWFLDALNATLEQAQQSCTKFLVETDSGRNTLATNCALNR
ncbi:hypothetical protein KAM344_38760 [Aeromonas caviae]|nr:hypothetical protein KAM344_38760 [Aeromonas caviae]